MKYLKQFGILLGITFAGELLSRITPLPIPSSIYGLLLLFILLMTKVLKLEQIKETGYFLIVIMPLMFIPAAVGLVGTWSSIQYIFIQVIVITVISTIVIMVATGHMTQWLVKKKEGRENERNH